MSDPTGATVSHSTAPAPRVDSRRTVAATLLSIIGVGLAVTVLTSTRGSSSGSGPEVTLDTSDLAFLTMLCVTAICASLLRLRTPRPAQWVVLIAGAALAAALTSLVSAAALPEYVDGVPLIPVGAVGIAVMLAAVTVAWPGSSTRERTALVLVFACVATATSAMMLM